MHGPQPHQAVVTVLYGTEYGFSKEIAQKLAAKLSASHDYWRALSSAQLCSASCCIMIAGIEPVCQNLIAKKGMCSTVRAANQETSNPRMQAAPAGHGRPA